MARKKEIKRRPPSTTIEGRQNQLISKAIDLVEKKLDDGTASSQILSHFLKLASTKAAIELEKIKLENELTTAKIEDIRSSKAAEKKYEEAIMAFKRYRGINDEDEDYDDYEEYEDY